MRKAVLLLLLLLSLVSFAACSQGDESSLPPVASGTVVVTPEASIPNIDPSIRGYITRINYAAESTEILVEYQPSEDVQPYTYEKAIVKLDVNTAIVTDDDEPMSASSLAVGMTVEAWFSDPTAESYPVLAYGQAVRVITKSDSMTGTSGLPQLTVTCGGSYAPVVTSAEWKDRQYTFDPLRTLLENTLGAAVSASPGDTVSLVFSDVPKSLSAQYSPSAVAVAGTALAVEDMARVVIPSDAKGELFVRINAEWDNGSAQYAFAVIVIENTVSEGR